MNESHSQTVQAVCSADRLDLLGWLEFAGLENDGSSKNGGGVEFAGLENDGVQQEQTYILHTMKNFNVYDM